MITSDEGISFLKLREGFRASAYKDQAGVWTIGYGTTSGVKPGDTITEERALETLLIHVQRIEDFLRRVVTIPLQQNQYDALVSFIYNVGENAFQNSQIHQMINHNCLSHIPYMMMRWKWVTINGQKVESLGLLDRREKEGYLWAIERTQPDNQSPLSTGRKE